MKNIKLALAMILVLLLSGFLAYAAPAISDSVAVVSKHKGSGYLYSSGSWKPVEVGMPVYEGDTIATKNDSFVEVVFDSATLVRVDADSQLKLTEIKRNENAARTIFNLLKGRIVAIVDHLKNPESAFEVHTRMAIAAVKGTELAVEEGSLGVYEGSVAWSNADGTKKVQVEFGNESDVTGPNAAPNPPSELKKLLHVKTQLNRMREDVNVFRNLRNTKQNVKEFLIQREKTGAQGNIKETSETNLAIGGVNSKHTEAVEKVQKLLSDRAHKELRNARSHAAEDLGYVNQQMQADLHLGKNMTDVHGNRIRMEEYITRPKPNAVELLSMTLRGERIDYLKVQNEFNTDLPKEIPKSAWNSKWVNTSSAQQLVMPEYFRTNELVRMSNGDDEVEMNTIFGYETVNANGPSLLVCPRGRSIHNEPALDSATNIWILPKYEYSLLINGDVKEHKLNILTQGSLTAPVYKWIRLEDDKTYTSMNDFNESLAELVSPALSVADQITAKNEVISRTFSDSLGVSLIQPTGGLYDLNGVIFTSAVSGTNAFNPGTITQIKLNTKLDLAAQTTRTYNDDSNLTLKIYLIDDYGKIQTHPTNPGDWLDLANNTNVELQLNSNQFADQTLGIDVVSKLLWWLSINPKNASAYDNGRPRL